MSQITKHVSYAEMVQTNVKGIDNTPNPSQLERIILLLNNVFEPLREHVGAPIKINSIFRSKKVNSAIGGSKTSQHMADNGAAMDIDDSYGHMSNNDMAIWIKHNVDFDQIIFEKPINGKSSWIHVSYKRTGNRKQVLIFDGRKYLDYKTHSHLIY